MKADVEKAVADLMTELAEVVRLMGGFDRQRFTAELERWFRRHHAELEANARDAARYQWLLKNATLIEGDHWIWEPEDADITPLHERIDYGMQSARPE